MVGLQLFTVGWMLVECSASLVAAKQANSSALLAFGSDSFVELLSACIVLLQFWKRFPLREEIATRVAATLLFVLCGVIAVTSVLGLIGGMSADTSLLGIAITSAALLLMPVVAFLKRRKAIAIGNRALAADSVQSATCAYLAAVTLASLGLNAWLHVPWIDPVAALVAVPIIYVEGRKAWRGIPCGCH